MDDYAQCTISLATLNQCLHFTIGQEKFLEKSRLNSSLVK